MNQLKEELADSLILLFSNSKDIPHDALRDKVSSLLEEKLYALNAPFCLLSDSSNLDCRLSCGCVITVDLEPQDVTSIKDYSCDADIDYCDIHEDSVEYKELLAEFAHDLLMKDADARWKHKKLFELTGL
jgi:hypothetical protein